MSEKTKKPQGAVVEADDDQLLYNPDSDSQVVAVEPDIITLGRYQEKKAKKDEQKEHKIEKV